MKITVRIVIAVMLVVGGVALMATQQSATTAQEAGDYFFKTPGIGESLQIARIYADAEDETHWEFISFFEGRPNATGGVYNSYPPSPQGPSPTARLVRLGLPLRGNLGFSMIAGDAVVPALHPLNRSYFMVLTGPGFSWKATDGTEVQARPGGPIFLGDDQGSKGHITRALGLDSVFMSIPVMGESPRRPCASAPSVLDCLMGK